MTNWRKILSLLLVLALAATMLAGCGKTEEAAPNADAPTQEQAKEPAKEAAPAETEEEIIEIT